MCPADALPARLNVADHLILPSLESAAARPYVVSAEGTLTRGALHAAASRVGHALRRLGVEPEQRVMLLMGETLAFPPCFWGALRIGAVPVPVSPLLTPAEHRLFLADSRAKALMIDAPLWPALAPHLPGLRALRQVVAVNGRVAGLPSLEELTVREPERLSGEPMSPDDVALWLYTSGSTGTPKAALHRARDLIETAAIFPREVLRLAPDDLGFSAARMCFAYGLGNTLLFPLASGSAAAILGQRPAPESLFAALVRFRPTLFYAGPALLHAMLATHRAWRGAGRPAPRLDSLRVAVSAGEALPAVVCEEWRRTFGHDLLDCVGSTENLTFFLANRPGRVRPGSAGEPIPGFELRLVDERGRDAAPGEPGTLWVKGPTAAARYWNRTALTRATLRGEWLVTGDRFRRDEEGYYWHLGRDDDLFKVGGSWVAPAEVEHALLAHPAVAECAVVGQRDAHGLGRAVAFVVARPRAETGENACEGLAESLHAHLAGRLAPFKIPTEFRFVSCLPRTPTGKIRRYALRT
jgi:benzoate-CoA ligase family protein